MPRSCPTPTDPRQPHPDGCSVLASGTLKPSPSALLLLTRLYQASEGAVPLTACVIPCVRFNRFVRLLTSPPHGCNTRYEWLVRPYSTGTFTQSETPSFAWRTSGLISGSSLRHLRGLCVSVVNNGSKDSPRRRRGGTENFKLGHYHFRRLIGQQRAGQLQSTTVFVIEVPSAHANELSYAGTAVPGSYPIARCLERG